MNDTAVQRNLLVVSGPSGCGKDTVVQILMDRHPGIELSVSATTRDPRPDEVNGVHYHFLSKELFEQYIEKGFLLEYANYVGNYYGTLRSEVEKRINEDITCVLVIEVMGTARVRRAYPECTTIFILPPSMEELERRLRSRGTESEEWVQKRLARAREELPLANDYDFQLVNADPYECADRLYEILQQRQNEE